MSETEAKDDAAPTFESTAFPTAADMRRWPGMTPSQQHAAIMRDVREGLDSPAAQHASKDDLIADVLADYAHAG